ncbi:hypothetical protein LCGC14_0263710 [marine sediment metagenome]|uniref:Uncharacterized protein n=1 Tax=marine sediment metagenome TaxID=412755 RepID=A0A0F9UHK7_9ZZZZ
MVRINMDALSEYVALLEQLGEEYDLIDQSGKMGDKRKKEIKKQINDISDKLGGKNQRVILPLPTLKKMFDRRITKKGGEVIEGKLRDVIGIKRFQNICDKITTYVLNTAKFEEARIQGRITEEELKEATSEVDYTPAVYFPVLTEEEEE